MKRALLIIMMSGVLFMSISKTLAEGETAYPDETPESSVTPDVAPTTEPTNIQETEAITESPEYDAMPTDSVFLLQEIDNNHIQLNEYVGFIIAVLIAGLIFLILTMFSMRWF